MRKHDEYQEFCALAIIGQLSLEQHRELSEHLRTCESCNRVAQQYVDAIHHFPVELAPLADRDVLEIQETSRAAHFLSRARIEGVEFSSDAMNAFVPRAEKKFRTGWTKFGGAAIAAMVLIGASAIVWNDRANPMQAALVAPVPIVSVPAAVPEKPVVTSTPAVDGRLSAELADERDRAAYYQRQSAELKGQLLAARLDAAQVSTQLTQQGQLVAQLSQQNSSQHTAIAQMSADMQRIKMARDHMLADYVADENRIHDLQLSVNNAHEAVERERQLNAAASDVRELMGARKLHIIDVYDSENGSVANKSFGRVIYAEGKSLIFYAFDLDKVHAGRKVVFQAWGERDGYEKDARKLGVFYIDSAVQKRWVMKVNDPAKLKSIDTVFVTVESHQDTPFPKGRRLLQAYLGSRPNHP